MKAFRSVLKFAIYTMVISLFFRFPEATILIAGLLGLFFMKIAD